MTQLIKYPSAHLAVGKSRRKEHSNRTYFLDDQQQFELELFNPTQSEVLAEISINGERISTSGLIIKPGQRVFLDRHIESKSKLKFETYEVDNLDEVETAIENNGKIKVEFFNKRIVPEPTPINQYIYTNYNTNWPLTTSGNTLCSGTHSTLTSSDVTFTTNFSTTSMGVGDGNISEFLNTGLVPSKELRETGRIGKGEQSEQEFTTLDIDFETYTFHVENIRILPSSSKPIEVNELQGKRYCSNCGTKLKSKWKFCSNCGSKI